VPQAEPVGEVVEVNNDGFRCEFSQRLAVGTKLYTVPPAQPPAQEPVTCRFCHDARGCWTWQCYHCGEIDDVQQPAAQPVQEPMRVYVENFAAMGGWVKDSGEGAFNYVQRISYAQGVEDATAHAQPVQEPLTHDEIEAIGDKVANEKLVGPVANFRVRFARAIEAAHNIKENT